MISQVKLLKTEILSDNWYVLKKISYEYKDAHGQVHTQIREAYDRGNGAAILLYNLSQKTLILTQQFRLPTFINGNQDGLLIEVCAGLLDEEHPEECIKREALEETGYKISNVKKVFEAYMSPGSVTEIIHFFIATYDHTMKESQGGGLYKEQENIDVLELSFQKALAMMQSGKIKDAKTMLLLQYLQIHLL